MSAKTPTQCADVIVIGAGVLGTFHAYFSAKSGLRVLLLERNALPNDASTRNFGMLPQSIVNPEDSWAVFARDTAEIYREIQQEHDISVRQTGSLYVASTELERQVLKEFAEHFGDTFGCSFLTAPQTLDLYPFVRSSYCTGALLFPDDLSLEPRQMLARLIPYMRSTEEIRYLPNTNVVGIESRGASCQVTDARGTTFEAERVMICSGAEYRTLLPELFAASQLEICKLQMMCTVPIPGFTLRRSILSGLSIRRYPAFASCPSYPLLRAEPLDPQIEEHGIHLLFKQSTGGSITIGDSHQYRDCTDVAALEERTDCAISGTILSYAQSMLKLPTWEIQEEWNGYYLVHPTEQIYTETIDGRIHIITGIAGKGMTTGPGFARHNVESLLAPPVVSL